MMEIRETTQTRPLNELRGSELKDHPQDNVQVPPMVVVADDDGEHRLLLSRLLRKAGFRVSLAQDGASLMKLLAANQPDLVLLDLMLPDDDGLVLCRRIRDTSDIPIIMLTALGQGTYKVAGLEMGADDYVAKPFDSDELLARIRAVLRRIRGQSGTTVSVQARRGYRFDGWTIDASKRQLMSPDQVLITLTSAEFDLLVAFVEHPQTILTREHLVELSRGRGSDGFDRSVDILVSRLRRKIEPNAKEPRIIKTIRSGGYLFAPDVGPLGPL
ncbi:MAG TPA: response regulator transcription factor [Terriglobales bacterium]|nr:response regulator transcription factor [Terriglobales bacterium]